MNSNFLLTTFEMQSSRLQNSYLRHKNSVLCALLLVGFLFVSTGCSDQTDQNRDAPETSASVYVEFEKTARAAALAWSAKHANASTVEQNANALVNAEQPFEYWIYLALLKDEQNNHYALQQRFARLRLHADSHLKATALQNDQLGINTNPAEPISQWRYSDVIAMDHRLDFLPEGLSRDVALEDDISRSYTQVQRAALDLSGADAALQKVWLGSFSARHVSASLCQPSIEIIAPNLNLKFAEAVQANEATDACKQTSTSQVVSLENFSTKSSVMRVEGNYQRGLENISLSGYGWFDRAWGVPPDTNNAAVVFDRGWLLLDDKTVVTLQRSKRASGRGPANTSGTLRQLGNEFSNASREPAELSGELIDIVIDDSDRQGLSWELNSHRNNLALQLKAKKTSEGINPYTNGASWFGVVSIEGSHSGYGFVDYTVSQIP